MHVAFLVLEDIARRATDEESADVANSPSFSSFDHMASRMLVVAIAILAIGAAQGAKSVW